MTEQAVEAFLVDWAERMSLSCDPQAIRDVLQRACGGQLDARGPDGDRASTLTVSGLPFEASVSGGRGSVTPAVRYVTEAATQETRFATRVAAQLAAIRDLVAWLPNGNESVADMLQAFVTTLYPDPTTVRARFRSATWLGIVHHIAAPRHVARLKVYGSPAIVPGALQRSTHRWPEFAGLAQVPDNEKLLKAVGAAIEVDARGEVNHKIYWRARTDNVATPMKLVRYFGDPAWEVISELVSCGIDAAELYRHNFFVCCAPGVFALHLSAKRGEDLTDIVTELATRHYGSPQALDALVRAAQTSGATWQYSAVGLGFSADRGIDKLNVYGTLSPDPAQLGDR